MRDTAKRTIVLSIIVTNGGFLNLPEFSMGNPITIKNLVVTFTYIATWIIVLGIGIKIKDRGLIKYSFVFWLITLFLGLVMWYVNVTGANVDWAIPLVILLIGQWYGINFFVQSYLANAIIITFISLLMFIISAISLKRTKSL